MWMLKKGRIGKKGDETVTCSVPDWWSFGRLYLAGIVVSSLSKENPNKLFMQTE